MLWLGNFLELVCALISQGPFHVIRTVFMPKDGERELTLNEKTDLFFHDYSIGPLFVQENYLSVRPIATEWVWKGLINLVSKGLKLCGMNF